MNLTVLQPPTAEIVTLAEAKRHLKVTNTQDDDYINSLIPVARQLAEQETGRTFLTTTYQMELMQFPWNYEWMVLYRSPVNFVISVQYADPVNGNNWLSYDLASQLFVQLGTPGRIARNAGWWGLANIYRPDSIRVVYKAGFTSDPNNVPAAYQELFGVAKLATLWILHELYDWRSPLSDMRAYEVSGPIQRLCNRLSDGHYAPTTQ